MKKRYLVVFFLLFGQTAYAAECYVKSGKVTSGKEVFEQGDKVKQCKGRGENAVVCFENKYDQQVCQDVSGNFDLSNSAQQKSSRSIMQLIKSLYAPETIKSYGGKRLKESEYLAGFPYGGILLPNSPLKFSTNDNVQGGMKSFLLYEKEVGTKPVFSTDQVNKRIVIPATKLRQGAKYKWMVQSGEKKYSGIFTIAQQQDQQEFEKELKTAQAKSDPSKSTKHLLRAILAKEYGFTFDMQQSIEAARDAITQEE